MAKYTPTKDASEKYSAQINMSNFSVSGGNFGQQKVWGGRLLVCHILMAINHFHSRYLTCQKSAGETDFVDNGSVKPWQ